jgi:hypothetical protein
MKKPPRIWSGFGILDLMNKDRLFGCFFQPFQNREDKGCGKKAGDNKY